MSGPSAAPGTAGGLVLASPRAAGCCWRPCWARRWRQSKPPWSASRSPAIGRDFQVGLTALQWVVTAYTMTLAGLLLLGGALGDKYGRKRVFLIGAIWFALCVPAQRGRARSRRSDPGPGPAGGGRRPADPGQPGHPGGGFRPADRGKAIGAWPGTAGSRRSARSSAAAGRGRVLAADLRHQPAAGRARGRGDHAARAGVPRPGREGTDRRGRRHAGHPGLVGPDLRADPGSRADWASPGVLAALAAGAVLLAAFVWQEHRSAAPTPPLSLFASAQFTANSDHVRGVRGDRRGAVPLPIELQQVIGVQARCRRACRCSR